MTTSVAGPARTVEASSKTRRAEVAGETDIVAVTAGGIAVTAETGGQLLIEVPQLQPNLYRTTVQLFKNCQCKCQFQYQC